MKNAFKSIIDPKMEQLIIGKKLGQETGINSISKGGIIVSPEVAKAQKEGGEKVDKALDNTKEQKESNEKSKFKKVEVEGDITGWTKLKKFTDFSGQITEVTESPDKNHRQVTLKNGKKCLLHEQTDKFKKTLPPIEKLLTDLLHLTTDQFTDENGNLIKGKWIEFNEEQKDIVKQLFKSQVVEKAGFCDSDGEFYGQGEYCYLGSESGEYILFNEDGVYLGNNNNLNCFFSAVRSEN